MPYGLNESCPLDNLTALSLLWKGWEWTASIMALKSIN
jgi:hypothetical protein